jgi:hypothetical protein
MTFQRAGHVISFHDGMPARSMSRSHGVRTSLRPIGAAVACRRDGVIRPTHQGRRVVEFDQARPLLTLLSVV